MLFFLRWFCRLREPLQANQADQKTKANSFHFHNGYIDSKQRIVVIDYISGVIGNESIELSILQVIDYQISFIEGPA